SKIIHYYDSINGREISYEEAFKNIKDAQERNRNHGWKEEQTEEISIGDNYYRLLDISYYFKEWEMIKKAYIKKAKNKLKKMTCKKIAITGSFGKTSTKNILHQIMKEEFDVCVSPKSYNTPMGVCRTVLENLKETDDFLILEFGARRKGDIEFLAEFVGVDFGVITPIGNCHLETFGSVENIENTKYELCEHTDCVVFNGKSASSKKLFDRYPKRKYMVCVENSFAYASDIYVGKDGSRFVMNLDDKKFFCKTKLLGKSNIDNIVVGVAVAYLLGENLFNIQKAIEKLEPTPHRLELIKGERSFVIDDSYNSNFDGFKEAVSILNEFDGKKIVVSPGIVELGKEQFKVNMEAGKLVSEVADVFVIMNKTNKEALYEGAKEGKCQIFFANTREEQLEVLKKVLGQGDVVLFENDFPDNLK
ncbi:MAG: UDP-N-acetylmuramoyl-tripeptide--D-alanyl-D-alanine ligase, partial [Clostridia bacterium]|nr:UDP-N-acetylmuramoyl-tripeptide--D-alanyl-D-alanine ligase [Clostridia bacterium]